MQWVRANMRVGPDVDVVCIEKATFKYKVQNYVAFINIH